ncbi:MAG: hypothetical protein RR320_08095, partial [Oscillospiraceae bacterium]
MLYQKTFRIFTASALSLCVFRAALKILAVDTETGFYLGSELPGTVFMVLLFAAAALLALCVWRTEDRGMTALHGNRLLEGVAAALGLLVLGSSIGPLGEALRLHASPDAAINRLPRWLLLSEHTLGVISGAVLVLLALWCISGAHRSSLQGSLALIPVVWQSLFTVDRFFGFWQVLTNADQLIETMFLVSASMFLLAHAGCLSGLAPQRRRAIAYSLLTALFGFVLVAGQLSAVAVLGSNV